MDTISNKELAAQLTERFGPVESAQVADIGGIGVLEVVLARTSAKTLTLQRWIEQIEVWDATVGKFSHRDPQTRFTVRGALPTEARTPVLLIATFDDRAEASAVAYLHDRIEHSDTVALVNQLASSF